MFSDNRVWTNERGEESVACWRGDSLGLRRLDEVGVDYFVITQERNEAVPARARKIRIECISGIDDKLTVLREQAERRGVPLAETAYLGNDVNDAECLAAVGVPVVPSDAWHEVVPLAGLVLTRAGRIRLRPRALRRRVERKAGAGMSDALFDLTGRVAVVTGGMGQLGQVYLAGLAERGVRVASFDVAGGDVPEGVRAYEVDVTERASIEAGLDAVSEEWGVPHVLVNNAGLDSPPDAPAEEVGPFEEYPEGAFDEVMDVNVKGTLLCCQVVGGAMAREGRGSIVNVSSVYGLLSPPQDLYEFRRARGETFFKPVAYSVSKSAILNLTRYLATYWAKTGVRVNTLTLGGVENDQPPEFLEAFAARSPMGRMLDAREALGAVVFLASDASSYVTGSNVVVDGGWSAW